MKLKQTFAAVAALAFTAASAQDTYPSKPITLVIPFAAGSGTDNVGRIVMQKLSDRLKQPIVIENRAKLHDLQNRELEQERDDFGQGAGTSPGQAGIQPDFSLYARIMEMPNRGTSYYLCEFTLSDLRNRTQVWTNAYEVRVKR